MATIDFHMWTDSGSCFQRKRQRWKTWSFGNCITTQRCTEENAVCPEFDPDSMAAFQLDQGMTAMLTGEDEQEREVECQYCHRIGFEWQQIEGKWRLVTPSGKIHKCKQYRGDRI
jgi:hypothetical protein